MFGGSIDGSVGEWRAIAVGRLERCGGGERVATAVGSPDGMCVGDVAIAIGVGETRCGESGTAGTIAGGETEPPPRIDLSGDLERPPRVRFTPPPVIDEPNSSIMCGETFRVEVVCGNGRALEDAGEEEEIAVAMATACCCCCCCCCG